MIYGENKSKLLKIITSCTIILITLVITYIPIAIPGLQQKLVIVSGTELQAPLQTLEAKFRQSNPQIKLELKFQGSQELVNRYINKRDDFQPAVLIPGNGEILTDISDRLRAIYKSEPFYDSPQPIAKTMLVGIAWPERGKILFPNGRFQWSKIEQAMQVINWGKIGGASSWGSFDFVMTDPTRSNSGQLTLDLWIKSESGVRINSTSFINLSVRSLLSLIKKSVYQPPRSTDILLQEFIVKGANQADIATVYESVALHRWQQSIATQGKPYQIYYLDPSMETTATAAIIRPNVDANTANAARKFLDFLTQPEQQAVFVQYGFRPVNDTVDVTAVANSPWNQNIPGAEVQPNITLLPAPTSQAIAEIQRLWERVD
ncbi:extracellular solute-binding protein [Nostoc sp. CCY0012]|uniref:extracellular solute-binding protein n=1 Tax=Nostoc sp. CCY0012 TaxID=1056123 RepID=UPI0039C6919D